MQWLFWHRSLRLDACLGAVACSPVGSATHDAAGFIAAAHRLMSVQLVREALSGAYAVSCHARERATRWRGAQEKQWQGAARLRCAAHCVRRALIGQQRWRDGGAHAERVRVAWGEPLVRNRAASIGILGVNDRRRRECGAAHAVPIAVRRGSCGAARRAGGERNQSLSVEQSNVSVSAARAARAAGCAPAPVRARASWRSARRREARGSGRVSGALPCPVRRASSARSLSRAFPVRTLLRSAPRAARGALAHASRRPPGGAAQPA